MSTKRELLQLHLIKAASMGASITSAAVDVRYSDNVGIQIHFPSSGSPVGVFSVEVSVDHAEDGFGNVTNVGNWIAIPLTASPTAAGGAGDFYLDLNQLSAPFLRVKYTRTSATGTLDVYVTGKTI